MQTWGGIAGRRETEIVLSQNALAGVSKLKSRVGDSCEEKPPGSQAEEQRKPKPTRVDKP